MEALLFPEDFLNLQEKEVHPSEECGADYDNYEKFTRKLWLPLTV